jgi:hypothetical protein
MRRPPRPPQQSVFANGRGLQVAITYIPFLQLVFQTESLNFKESLVIGVLSSFVFFAAEIKKAVFRRRTGIR